VFIDPHWNLELGVLEHHRTLVGRDYTNGAAQHAAALRFPTTHSFMSLPNAC